MEGARPPKTGARKRGPLTLWPPGTREAPRPPARPPAASPARAACRARRCGRCGALPGAGAEGGHLLTSGRWAAAAGCCLLLAQAYLMAAQTVRERAKEVGNQGKRRVTCCNHQDQCRVMRGRALTFDRSHPAGPPLQPGLLFQAGAPGLVASEPVSRVRRQAGGGSRSRVTTGGPRGRGGGPSSAARAKAVPSNLLANQARRGHGQAGSRAAAAGDRGWGLREAALPSSQGLISP